MASRQQSQSSLPPYSRLPSVDEQVLAVAPNFPLAVEAIQVVQEWFPGTSAGDTWEFIQQLTHLIRADVRNWQTERTGGSHESTTERAAEDSPPSTTSKDSPMPDCYDHGPKDLFFLPLMRLPDLSRTAPFT